MTSRLVGRVALVTGAARGQGRAHAQRLSAEGADVIVANAGICCPAPWDQITAEAFRDTIDTNVIGTWNTVMAGAPHIINGGRGGSIILIGSAAGVKMQAFMVHYTASKHAVTGMARAFAAELGRHSIRVNSLHPGAVATPMGTGRMREALQSASDSYPHLQGMHKPLLPEGIAQPEDIADAVAWLASDEAKFVTASTVSVDLGVANC